MQHLEKEQKRLSGPSIDVEVFHALGNSNRARIIELLWGTRMHVSEIAAHFSLSIPGVSRYLKDLHQAKLVESEREANFIFYRVCREKFLEVMHRAMPTEPCTPIEKSDRGFAENLQDILSQVERMRMIADEVERLLVVEQVSMNATEGGETSSIPIPTARDLKALRKKLGLSVEEAAKRVYVKESTWYGWEHPSQNRRPSPSHAKLIKLLEDGVI